MAVSSPPPWLRAVPQRVLRIREEVQDHLLELETHRDRSGTSVRLLQTVTGAPSSTLRMAALIRA